MFVSSSLQIYRATHASLADPPATPSCIHVHWRSLRAQVEQTGRTLSHLVLSARQLKQETATLFRRRLAGLGLTMLQVLMVDVVTRS